MYLGRRRAGGRRRRDDLLEAPAEPHGHRQVVRRGVLAGWSGAAPSSSTT